MLLDRGYNPRRSFYIAFGHDEEVLKPLYFITSVLPFSCVTVYKLAYRYTYNHVFSSLDYVLTQ